MTGDVTDVSLTMEMPQLAPGGYPQRSAPALCRGDESARRRSSEARGVTVAPPLGRLRRTSSRACRDGRRAASVESYRAPSASTCAAPELTALLLEELDVALELPHKTLLTLLRHAREVVLKSDLGSLKPSQVHLDTARGTGVAVSANMRETVTPLEFSVEGRAWISP